MRFYSLAKHQATKFANERNCKIWIAKANKKEEYKIEFKNSTTKNFSIIETIEPNKKEL